MTEYRWQCLDCEAWGVPGEDTSDELPALIAEAQAHADDEGHDVEVVRVIEYLEPADDDGTPPSLRHD